MKKFNSSRALVALSAASIALIPLAGTLQAQPTSNGNGPPSQAPAWGYRGERGSNGNRGKKNNRDNRGHRGNRDNRDNRDYDDDNDYRNDRNGAPRGERGDFGNRVTLEGVVTNVRNTREFEVRGGGRTFLVRSDNSVSVNTGDRVLLRGTFDNNNFRAQSVRVLRSGTGGVFNDDFGSGVNRNVDFPGTVTRILSSREIEVRADNGRVYRVETRGNVGSIGVGSRVRVTGDASGTRVRNASVFASGSNTGNNNGGVLGDILGGNSGVGRSVDFPARIVSIDAGRDEAVVRGDNGRTYQVRGRELRGFNAGDRVRVRGVSRVGFIDLRNLDRI